MNRSVYNFIKEPREKLYHGIINLALNYSDTILLVIRESIGIESSAKYLLERLDKFLKQKNDSSEWPGTKLLKGGTALVYQYKLYAESADILKDTTSGLYDWIQPNLPEDLCLLRPDGSPYLVTISHEKDAYLRLTQEEKDILVKTIPEFKLLLELE